MTEEEIDKMADDFVNSQEFTKVYGIARKAECGAFWKKGFLTREKYIAELEKENAELKEQISTKDILIKELQEQKMYWKESSFDWRHKFFKLDKVKRLIKKDKELTKAKKYIKLLLMNCVGVYESTGKTIAEIQAEAEQFLKEE